MRHIPTIEEVTGGIKHTETMLRQTNDLIRDGNPGWLDRRGFLL